MAVLRSLSLALVAATLAGAVEDVCVDPARCAAASLGAEEQGVNLLQVGAAAAEHGRGMRPEAVVSKPVATVVAKTAAAVLKSVVHAAGTAAAKPAAAKTTAAQPAAAKTTAAKPVAAFLGVAAKGNTTAGRVVRHGDVSVGRVYGDGTCDKVSGGTCFTGSCDPSSGATCGNFGMCLCPDYTCASEHGTCDFSASEVASAVASGVTNVGEQVTALASAIPGVSESISGLSGIVGVAGQVFSETLGLHGGCGRLVSSCIFSGCASTVENTAMCDYGACSCRQNFCYSELQGQPYCTVDIDAITNAVNYMR